MNPTEVPCVDIFSSKKNLQFYLFIFIFVYLTVPTSNFIGFHIQKILAYHFLEKDPNQPLL